MEAKAEMDRARQLAELHRAQQLCQQHLADFLQQIGNTFNHMDPASMEEVAGRCASAACLLQQGANSCNFAAVMLRGWLELRNSSHQQDASSVTIL